MPSRGAAIAMLLVLPSCIGALEYADPALNETTLDETRPDAAADAAVDANAESRPGLDSTATEGAAVATTETDPDATPATLDAAVLAEVHTAAEQLGLEPQTSGETVSAELEVYFQTNSATLLPRSEPALQTALRLLTSQPRITTAQIAGHSDARGSAEYNLRLTSARAFAVTRWLVDHGVACERLEAVGYGEGRPIDHNMTAGGWARNRRVELVVLGVDGVTVIDTTGTVFGDPCDAQRDPNEQLCGTDCG